ncbi:MAG: serine/threonine protein kinase [Fibromonadaceae bacterium]|jgi:serine/threonine protein kinase|nr:serine/threonine protein kinase [Fibromonadaceae bacterium]
MSSEIFPRPFNADFELLGVLGKGGMGSVYKARQVKLNRIVALKVLHIEGDSEEEKEAEKRFYSEAQAMKELNHQNLATVYDFGKQGDKIFIAMTFVEGESLSDIIKREKKLTVKRAIYIAWQIARGLEYAHEREVIHRDIKPSNIMIKKNNEVCIIDFGISISTHSQRLTNPGMTMGTPEYMSPEQCQNKNVTHQSDIYSFGIVFYEMLTGDPPFVGGASLSILNRHLQEAPKSLRKKNDEVSEELEKIIFKCLEKKTDQRYRTFATFIEELKNIMNGTTTQEPPKSLAGRLSKAERIMFFILCIILPFLLVIMVILLSFKKPPENLPAINYLKPNQSWMLQSVPSEISINSLFDGNLGTAWIIQKNSALKANNGILVTIRFTKPVFISNLGIAIGDQSDWDNFQKYNKPKDIWIRYANSTVKEHKVNEQSSVRKISLEDKLGVQYVPWTPVEVTELMFELKAMQNDSKNDDLAISEIRIFGMEL